MKTAGYLDTKDQDEINCLFVPPKKGKTDETGHFVGTEIDSTDFKNENLASKVRKNKTRKPYTSKEKIENIPKDAETVETINILEEIATLKPGKMHNLLPKKLVKNIKN